LKNRIIGGLKIRAKIVFLKSLRIWYKKFTKCCRFRWFFDGVDYLF